MPQRILAAGGGQWLPLRDLEQTRVAVAVVVRKHLRPLRGDAGRVVRIADDRVVPVGPHHAHHRQQREAVAGQVLIRVEVVEALAVLVEVALRVGVARDDVRDLLQPAEMHRGV